MKLSPEKEAKLFVGVGLGIALSIVAILVCIICQLFKMANAYEESLTNQLVLEDKQVEEFPYPVYETYYVDPYEEEQEESVDASTEVNTRLYSVIMDQSDMLKLYVSHTSEPELEIVPEEQNKIETHSSYYVYTSSKDILGDKYNETDEYFGWSKEDYDYLLMTIVGEAQCCSYEEQLYVGSVVLNRLMSDRFSGNTIKSIVLTENQYACFNESCGTAYRTPTQENIDAALEVLKYGSFLPSNVVFQALFKQGSKVYIRMEDTGTYFCCL